MESKLDGEFKVRLGDSIINNKPSNLMTFRYDFIPESVDQKAAGDVQLDATNKAISVELPNVSGSNSSHTNYKGCLNEASKEYVLIYNPETKDMVLERLDFVSNLKKSRDTFVHKPIKRKEEGRLSDSSDEEHPKSSKKSNQNYAPAKTAATNTKNVGLFGPEDDEEEEEEIVATTTAAIVVREKEQQVDDEKDEPAIMSESEDEDDVDPSMIGEKPVEETMGGLDLSDEEEEGHKPLVEAAELARRDLQLTDSSSSDGSDSSTDSGSSTDDEDHRRLCPAAAASVVPSVAAPSAAKRPDNFHLSSSDSDEDN